MRHDERSGRLKVCEDVGRKNRIGWEREWKQTKGKREGKVGRDG